MNIAITFRQMDTSEAAKAYAQEKISKLQKFLRKPMETQVTLSVQKTMHIAEVVVHCGPAHFHAHEECSDMYGSIDRVCDKLEAQIRSDHDLRIAKTKKRGERISTRNMAAGTGTDGE